MAHEAPTARQTGTRHLEPYRPSKLVAWVAGIMGLLMVIAGTGHLVGVVAAAVHQHKPFGFRLVSLLAIGGMLLYPGLLNLGISKSIWRGRQWAFAMSAFATVALLAYAILLLFMKTPPDPTDPFAGASSTAGALAMILSMYLAFLLPGWIRLRKRHRAHVSWDPLVPGAFSRSFRLGEWIGAPVTPLFEDWLLGRLEDRLHDRHAEWIGMRAVRPYHVVLNGWYFYSLEFLPVTLRAIARSLPGMLARLIRTPRRVAVAFPPVARFGVPLYEREWREDLLPYYRNAVRDATLAVGQAPIEELPGVIDRLADIAGDYFASMAIVAGYAYKAEYNLARWYRRHLGELGESHLPLLLGLVPAPATPASHLVESLDWWYPTLGERTPTVEVAVRGRDLADVASRLGAQRLAAVSRVHQALRSPRERRTFDGLLAEAQHAASVREEQVASFTLAWPLFRTVLRRVADALVATGKIDAPDDVYFLKRSELEEVISAESGGDAWADRETSRLQAAVAERRAARERAARLVAPLFAGPLPRLVRAMLVTGRSFFGATTCPDALLHGAPASPGIATGAVRVIRDLADAERLQPGEILVAPMTTPAWTPLFRIAAGVVTDVGSALSHASIVAREYGIPAVLGCGDATARLTVGQRVMVDGAAGIVTREDYPRGAR